MRRGLQREETRVSSGQPVDLTNLSEIVDHDKDLLEELINEFYRSAESAITLLGTLKDQDGENREWEKTAHALKGLSYNLGATGLGDIAKEAQESAAKSSSEKSDLYDRLTAEHSNVVAFLKAR